jgi:K+-sensing histidine kinase KdpD
VAIQAKLGDFWSAAIVATVAAFALAFSFIPPAFSFGVANPLDAIVLLTFVIIAFVITHLMLVYRA